MPAKKDATPKKVVCPVCKNAAGVRARYTGRFTCRNCNLDFK